MPIRVTLPDGSIANFPDGMAPADIEKALSAAKIPEAPVAEEPGLLQRGWEFVKSHPTELGAIAGAIAAVPLTGGASLVPAIAAAGLGGAGGAGLGMLAGAAYGAPNIPSTSMGVLKTMGEQGATQAAAEAGGRAIQAGLKAGAGRLYQSVLKPTVAAQREFPDLIRTGLTNAIPVSEWGAEKAGALVGASRDAATQLVTDAAAQPNAARINPRQAVAGITSAVKNVKDLPVARPQLQAIGDYARQYLAEHPSAIPLDTAQQSVRATDRFYDPAYRATMDRGNPVTTGSAAAALGINNETRQLLRQAVPGLAEQNAQTQALEGLRQAVERRAGVQANRSAVGMQHLINAGVGASAGVYGGKEKGLGTFAAMEALTNPAIASRLAIVGSQLGHVPIPQLLRAGILATLNGSDAATEETR